MPTYEYRCPEGHDFERFYRKISDATAEVACPTCGKIATRQLSAGAGLLFKGSGFYLTDYGKNAHRGTAPKPSGEASSTSSGESKPAAKEGAAKESKAESKPADKPAPKKSSGSES